MWELDCEEGWALKNWCIWNVMLEKTLESALDFKEIQPVHSERDQPWDFFGRKDAKAEALVLWPPHAKSWLIGKDSDAGRDWGQEEKGTTEDEMAGGHHGLDARESEWTPWDGDGQGGLACCDSWGRKESDTTERLNWTDSLQQSYTSLTGFPGGSVLKNPPVNAGDLGLVAWVGKIPCTRKWQPSILAWRARVMEPQSQTRFRDQTWTTNTTLMLYWKTVGVFKTLLKWDCLSIFN